MYIGFQQGIFDSITQRERSHNDSSGARQSRVRFISVARALQCLFSFGTLNENRLIKYYCFM